LTWGAALGEGVGAAVGCGADSSDSPWQDSRPRTKRGTKTAEREERKSMAGSMGCHGQAEWDEAQPNGVSLVSEERSLSPRAKTEVSASIQRLFSR